MAPLKPAPNGRGQGQPGRNTRTPPASAAKGAAKRGVKPAPKGPAKKGGRDASLYAAMLDSAKTPIMFCDRDMIIRYANPLTIQTLKKLEKYLPIRAEDLVGQSIDIFHKDPAHQRRMLEEPGRIPPLTHIQIGGETLELRVSPVMGGSGMMGAMVTWDVVTARVAMEAQNADYAGQVAAIQKSLAVIEFKLDGTISAANDNFLNTLGYSLGDVQGRHHSMFADPTYASSFEYKEFWARLGRGEPQTGEFKRFGRRGRTA